VTDHFWVYVRDDRRSGSHEPAAIWFDISSDRKGVHPQTRLAAFHGIVQADAYSGYVEPKFMLRLRYRARIPLWELARVCT
jgi:hypothetical protein